MATELREHQSLAMERLRRSIAGGCRRVVLQAPTGAGKTRIAAAVVEGARAKGNRVLFTVPALSLVDQTVEMFYHEGIYDVGVIQADHMLTDWSKPVQVASVQTLMRRPLPEAHVVVIDEAHRFFDWYGTWMKMPAWQQIPFIGLSATPWTRGLGKYYDELIIAATTQELIDAGYLSKFRVFAPAHPDLAGVRTVAGDYHEGDLGTAMDKAPLVADIVDTWLKRGEDRSTLCFAVNCAHAKNICERFDAAGVSAAYMDAYTEVNERSIIFRKFQAGEIKVICNVGVLTIGVDLDVRCLILARPTKSEILFVQILGRCLRIADGKKDALVLDHSDTHSRLGFVTDIHHEHLDMGRERQKAKPREALPKECPQCAALRPPRVAVCPECGFKPEVTSRITTEEGELEEIAPGVARKPYKPKPIQLTMFEKADLYGQLKWYAQQHGYKDGWAASKYKARTGVWPNDPSIRNAEPMEPTARVRDWIISEQIRWAKSKRREQSHV